MQPVVVQGVGASGVGAALGRAQPPGGGGEHAERGGGQADPAGEPGPPDRGDRRDRTVVGRRRGVEVAVVLVDGQLGRVGGQRHQPLDLPGRLGAPGQGEGAGIAAAGQQQRPLGVEHRLGHHRRRLALDGGQGESVVPPARRVEDHDPHEARLEGVGRPGDAEVDAPAGGRLEHLGRTLEVATVLVEAAEQVARPQLRAVRTGLASLGDRLVEPGGHLGDRAVALHPGEGDEHVGGQARHVLLLRQCQRLEPRLTRVVAPAVGGQDAGVQRERLRPLAGRAAGEQGHRLGGPGQGVVVVLGVDEQQALRQGRQQPGPVGGGGAVREPVEVLARDAHRLGGLTRRLQGVGGARDERRLVEVGDLGALAEQGERLEVVLGRLVGATDRGRLVAGLHAGADGGGHVTGQAGVPGQLGRGAGEASGDEGAGVGRVPAGPARPAAGRRRPPRRAARAGRRRTGRARPPGRCRPRRSAAPGPGRRRPVRWPRRAGRGRPGGRPRPRPHDLAGGGVEPVEPDQEQPGQVVGEDLVGTAGADQLLDEEGVALGPVDDGRHLGLGQGAVGLEHPHRGGDVVAGERLELEPLDAAAGGTTRRPGGAAGGDGAGRRSGRTPPARPGRRTGGRRGS